MKCYSIATVIILIVCKGIIERLTGLQISEFDE